MLSIHGCTCLLVAIRNGMETIDKKCSLVSTVCFNCSSQIIVLKHDFNSMLHKIVSDIEISYTYISVNRIPLLGVLL